jgi:hypothetical protein
MRLLAQEGKLCSAQGDLKDLKGFYLYIIPSLCDVIVQGGWTGPDGTRPTTIRALRSQMWAMGFNDNSTRRLEGHRIHIHNLHIVMSCICC